MSTKVPRYLYSSLYPLPLGSCPALSLAAPTTFSIALKCVNAVFFSGSSPFTVRHSNHEHPTPGVVGWGNSTKFYTGRLHPEVQTLTLLYTIFDRKVTPFVYLPQKMVPLSCTVESRFLKPSVSRTSK